YLGHVTFSTELKDALPDSEIILVTVSDNAINEVCSMLSTLPVQRRILLHTSGIKSYHEFDTLQEHDAEIGSLHPLQSFIHVEEAIQNLPGTYYAVEGTQAAIDAAKKLVNDLEGHSMSMNADLKSLYHAGACISANYLVALLRLGELFFKKSGVESDQIIPAFSALLKGILRNIQSRGTLESITGPIARGDSETLKMQLNSIRTNFPQHLPIFRALSLLCVNAVFEKANTNPDLIDEIMWLLEQNLMEDSISGENEEKAPQSNRKI
ncbi:MAG: hypothetical protein A2161_12085, partial [Candidatus Schekmanbacteria bacterium RBG_13_48_7]